MKKFLKILLFIFLSMGIQKAQADVSFNVVVIPADLFKVSSNYYGYPEMSEIIANDVIRYFNSSGRINSPSLYYIRKALEGNPQIKNYTNSIVTRYTRDKSLDFAAMKAISKMFNANSLMIISNDVPVEGAYVRRNIWEMLVLSTDFDISYPYTMETNVTLVDTVNDLVMWNGVYRKNISDENGNFKAPNSSDAYAKLEYFKMYSKDILGKTIAQNIYLRFFPKVVDPQPLVNDEKPQGAYFRFETKAPIPTRNKLLGDEKFRNVDENGEIIDDSYGEVMFGI